MKELLIILALFINSAPLLAQNDQGQTTKRVISIVDSSHAENLILEESFEVKVPIDSVWNAFTTKEGWESWATAKAEVDFKVSGLIRTNYNKDGEIGDESTVTLHIINYVPKRMLTLQAEITKNFPAFMKEDEKELFNTILFEEISPTKTRVVSYGIGYKLNDKYIPLLKFFIEANEATYMKLITYLETGTPSANY